LKKLETQIKIDAPIEQVWSILTDYPNYTLWNPYLVCIEGPATAGAHIKVHSVNTPGSQPMLATVRVVSVEPFTMRWEGGLPDPNAFKGDHWFNLSKIGNGTQLDHFEYFSGTRCDGILETYGDLIHANFVRFNEALARYAESLD
jgi:hypothetical protein